jgi:hypothetical protein
MSCCLVKLKDNSTFTLPCAEFLFCCFHPFSNPFALSNYKPFCRQYCKVQVAIFWVLRTGIDMVGYQRFGGPCCLHLQGDYMRHSPEDRDLKLHGFENFRSHNIVKS